MLGPRRMINPSDLRGIQSPTHLRARKLSDRTSPDARLATATWWPALQNIPKIDVSIRAWPSAQLLRWLSDSPLAHTRNLSPGSPLDTRVESVCAPPPLKVRRKWIWAPCTFDPCPGACALQIATPLYALQEQGARLGRARHIPCTDSPFGDESPGPRPRRSL